MVQPCGGADRRVPGLGPWAAAVALGGGPAGLGDVIVSSRSLSCATNMAQLHLIDCGYANRRSGSLQIICYPPARRDRNVRYVSTRGEAPPLGFLDVTLTGLARDGGLYVPETWPRFNPQAIAGFFGRPYAEVAVDVMRPFLGNSIPQADLARMAREAYGTFRHPATVPLVQIGPGTFLLELFHGPTLAFKDVAMQLL